MYLYLKKKRKRLLSFTSVLMIFVLSISCYATGSIEELEEETESIEAELGDINEEIIEISEELEELNHQIELTEAQMSKTLEALEIATQEEEEQYESMKVRIRYMYENGGTTFLELLFSAESMADFINKTEFITNVMEYDRNMLEELTIVREEIEFEEESAIAEQEVLIALQESAEAKELELQTKADELAIDLEAVQAEIEEVKAEEARLAAEAAAKAAAEAAALAQASTSGGSYSASANELDIFAALLDCEAGEDYSARLAVATVIMNRVESSSFPNSVYDVIYASGQFSPTWTGKLSAKLEMGASSLSYQVAQDAMNGVQIDSISNCYYFLHAGSSEREGVVIGGNVFFTGW